MEYSAQIQQQLNDKTFAIEAPAMILSAFVEEAACYAPAIEDTKPVLSLVQQILAILFAFHQHTDIHRIEASFKLRQLRYTIERFEAEDIPKNLFTALPSSKVSIRKLAAFYLETGMGIHESLLALLEKLAKLYKAHTN